MKESNEKRHGDFQLVKETAGRLDVNLLGPAMESTRIMNEFEATRMAAAIDLAAHYVRSYRILLLECEEDEQAMAAVLIAFTGLFDLTDRLANFQAYPRKVLQSVCTLLDEVGNLFPMSNILQFAVNRLRLYVQPVPFVRTKLAPYGWREIKLDHCRYGSRSCCLSLFPKEGVQDYMLPVRLWHRQHRQVSIATYRKLFDGEPLTGFIDMIKFPSDAELLGESGMTDNLSEKDFVTFGRDARIDEGTLSFELARRNLEHCSAQLRKAGFMTD